MTRKYRKTDINYKNVNRIFTHLGMKLFFQYTPVSTFILNAIFFYLYVLKSILSKLFTFEMIQHNLSKISVDISLIILTNFHRFVQSILSSLLTAIKAAMKAETGKRFTFEANVAKQSMISETRPRTSACSFKYII